MLGAILRLLFLARKPFWFDECFSVEVARLSWHDFAFLLWRREANMSLYYTLLRGWLHFGGSPFFIRSLSVVFSVASLPAIYWLAARMFNRRVAFLAVALMAVNAYSIRYAQEARSYSLFVLLAVLSSGFLVSALRDESSRSRYFYGIFSVLAVYTHLYALLLLEAQWLAVRGVRRLPDLRSRELRRTWIWIAVDSLPLVIFAAKTGAGPIRWIPRPTFYEILQFAEHIAGNAGIFLLLLYLAACALALFYGRHESWNLRFLCLWLIFPVGLVLLLSLARPLFLGRYFIFCLPPFVILAAFGLSRLPKTWMMSVGMAAMLLLSLAGTSSYYARDFDLDRDDSQGATNYILDHALPGDAILFHIAEARVPYEFFKSRREETRSGDRVAPGPEILYPRHGDALDYRDFTGKPATDFVQSLPGRYARIWLVLMSNGTPDKPDATTEMLNRVLGDEMSPVEVNHFSQVEVRLYQRR